VDGAAAAAATQASAAAQADPVEVHAMQQVRDNGEAIVGAAAWAAARGPPEPGMVGVYGRASWQKLLATSRRRHIARRQRIAPSSVR